MKIIIAPDKFKGTLKAIEVAQAVERGIKKILPEADTVLLPLADGGEGTVDAVVKATDGRTIHCPATGPLGQEVRANFGLFSSLDNPQNQSAIIEMAAASGLHLVPLNKRNPLITTTYGTGELIKTTLDHDVTEIIVGIGDSATVDGGMGMAQALGVRFFDKAARELGRGGEELRKIDRLDVSGLDQRLSNVKIRVASDVTNPLYGPSGAAHVYGPQKGATSDMINILEEGIKNYAQNIRKFLGKDVSNIAGAGAAGGLGAGLIAFLNAQIESGIELIMNLIGFKDKLLGADAVITGEGTIDNQTFFGKAPLGVAGLARKNHIPVYAICGQKGEGAEKAGDYGIKQVFALTDKATSMDDAYRNATQYVEMASEELAKEVSWLPQ